MIEDNVFYHHNDKTVQYDIATPDDTGEYAPAEGLIGLTILIAATPGGPALHATLTDLPLAERPEMPGRYFVDVDGEAIADHMPPDEPVYVGVKLPGNILVWSDYMVREFRR